MGTEMARFLPNSQTQSRSSTLFQVEEANADVVGDVNGPKPYWVRSEVEYVFVLDSYKMVVADKEVEKAIANDMGWWLFLWGRMKDIGPSNSTEVSRLNYTLRMVQVTQEKRGTTSKSR
jgi:hypothetical protein